MIPSLLINNTIAVIPYRSGKSIPERDYFPAGSYLTYAAAKEVWDLYGVPENIAYRACDGGHDHRPSDFAVLMDFMQGGNGMLKGYVDRR